LEITMTTHPYRSAVRLDLDLDLPPVTPPYDCIFCRTRRAVRRIPLRTMLWCALSLLCLVSSASSAVLAHDSARDAKQALAKVAAQERAARAEVERRETNARPRAPAASPTPTAHAAPEVTVVSPSPPMGSWRGIEKAGQYEFFVDRSILEKALEDGADLHRSTRVVPEQEGGKVTGVRVYGVRPDTLLGTLGFVDGDSIQAVNGFDVTVPERALEAYARLRTSSELWVRLKRRGSMVYLRYHVA
jgi:hypothetical protein